MPGAVLCALLVCLIGSSQQAFDVDTVIIPFFTVTLVLCLGTVLVYNLNIDGGFLTLKKMCHKRKQAEWNRFLQSFRFFPRYLIIGFIIESLNSAASQFKPMKMHKSSLYGFRFLVFVLSSWIL